MYWKDGSCYKGNWVDNVQNGYGKIIMPDGSIHEGIFKNNVFHGPTTLDEIKENNYDDSQYFTIKNAKSSHNQSKIRLKSKLNIASRLKQTSTQKDLHGHRKTATLNVSHRNSHKSVRIKNLSSGRKLDVCLF